MKLLRLTIALGLVTLWVASGAPTVWSGWRAAIGTPSTAGVPYDALLATTPQGAINRLLAIVRDECTAPVALLVVSNEPAVWLRGNYFLYPRHIDVIQAPDGFTHADLDSHTGGCLLAYGDQPTRLTPFTARLDRLACVEQDCVYRIRPQ